MNTDIFLLFQILFAFNFHLIINIFIYIYKEDFHCDFKQIIIYFLIVYQNLIFQVHYYLENQKKANYKIFLNSSKIISFKLWNVFMLLES